MKLYQVDNAMMTTRLKIIFGCLIGVVLLGSPATVFGQANTDGLVAVGVAKSEGMADRMRVTMTVKAKGADMEKAIEVLKKRQKSAKIKMEKMGVIEDSIEFGSISTGAGGGRQAQIMQAMMNQARGDKRIERMMKVKPPASVQVTLSADWKLDVDLDEVEILISVDKLKTKIVDADIDSASEKDELTAAQEELAEEMAQMANRYGESGESSGPTFSFVRKVSADDVKKLVAEAVADGKKKAQELADSTGVKLGAIYRVASTNRGPVADYYDPYGGYRSRPASSSKTDDDGTLHEVSDSPNVTVSRSIAFAFKIESE